MIPLKALADLVQEKLGSTYRVDIDNYPYVEEETPVVLYASRVPYAVDNNIEALNLRLEMDATSSTARDKKYHNDNIANLFEALNNQKYLIEAPDKSYHVKFYLQSSEPIDTRIDCGRFVTQYQIIGSALVTSSSTVFADDKEFYLNNHKLTVISYAVDLTLDHTNLHTVGEIEQIPTPSNKTRTYSLVFLVDDSDILTGIESLVIGGISEALSDTYSLKMKKSTGSIITRDVMLINAKDSGSVGGFSTMQAVFKAV